MCDRGQSNQPLEVAAVGGRPHFWRLVAGQYGGRKCDRGQSKQPLEVGALWGTPCFSSLAA
eukprot:11542240-Karenia_brevis.AAC.1